MGPSGFTGNGGAMAGSRPTSPIPCATITRSRRSPAVGTGCFVSVMARPRRPARCCGSSTEPLREQAAHDAGAHEPRDGRARMNRDDPQGYVELQVTTHFSFLRGASSPDELFAAAALLGLPALGVVDRNSVAG